MIHPLRIAKTLEYLMKQAFDKKAKLIGSLGKGKKHSKHDIDILLPSLKYSKTLHHTLSEFLDAEDSERTDWGGIFFHDTKFGNVNIFFSTKDFTR